MPLIKGSPLAGSARQCGPTLMIGMAAAVLAIFGSIWVVSHRHNETKPQAAKPAAVSNLPTR